jgi:GTPase SAR1 family protein
MASRAVANVEEYTVVVLGWGGVGKSAFITQVYLTYLSPITR